MTAVPAPNRLSRRRLARHRISVPLDVTILRSGASDTLPGRSVNLCEQGIAAVLAGELVPGDNVSVEVQLTASAEPLRAKAQVRHHDNLQCGMEFVALTPEQQAAIREAQAKSETKAMPTKTADIHSATGGGSDGPDSPTRTSRLPLMRRPAFWISLIALLAILAGLGWWRWNREWEKIEAGLPTRENSTVDSSRVQVGAGDMERLLLHRVEPEYPAAARKARLQGVIVLDIVVGRDGSVIGMRPMNGTDLLARSAMDALRWWKFEPYRLNGEPAIVETTVAMEFKP
jgi:TonB family protein